MRISYDLERLEGNFTEKKLVNGIKGKFTELSRVDAFRLFVKKNPKNKRKVFESVVEDNQQPYKLRFMAINELGNEISDEGQKILLKNLETKDDRILLKVLKALGKVGDKKVLNNLNKVKVSMGSFLYEHLNFAKQLIAYRNRSKLELIEPPSERKLLKIDKRMAIKLNTKMANIRKVGSFIKQVQSQLPGIKLSPKGVAQIKCRSDEFLLAFNYNFQDKREFLSLKKTSGIPLVMLKKRDCPDEYFLSHYFFTHPSEKKDELILTGVRPGGTITYAGIAKIENDGFVFSFKTVINPYIAGLDLNGEFNYQTHSFIFHEALSETRIDRKQNPRKTPKLAVFEG